MLKSNFINFFKSRSTQMFALSGTLFFLLHVSCQKKGEVIEKIGDYSVTTGDYEQFYNTFLSNVVSSSGVDEETIARFECNPDTLTKNTPFKVLFDKLKPENNYQEYREMRIFEQVARQEGFLKKEKIKLILDQVLLNATVELYLREKLRERYIVTQEAKQDRCEELRKQQPQQVGLLPLETCLFLAELNLRQEFNAREMGNLQNEIKESISVKKNNKFDRKSYLSSFVPYENLRKRGGCIDDSASEDSAP